MSFDPKKFIKYSLENLYNVEYIQMGNGSCVFQTCINELNEEDKHNKVDYLNSFNNDAEYLTDLLLKIREKINKYKQYIDNNDDDDDFKYYPNYGPFEAYCHNVFIYKSLMNRLYHISNKLKIPLNFTIKNDWNNKMVELKANGWALEEYISYARDVLELNKYVGVGVLDPRNCYESPNISSEEED